MPKLVVQPASLPSAVTRGPRTLMGTAARLFGLRTRVDRRTYLAWGFGLAALKFALDTLIVYAFTGKTWSPIGYIVPSITLRSEAVGPGPAVMGVLLPVVALPFLWVGLSMSVRRAADAGISPWRGTLFLVPIVNYCVIVYLCIVPSHGAAVWEPTGTGPYRKAVPVSERPVPPPEIPPGAKAALFGGLASVAIGLCMIWLSVYGLGVYGAALFFVTPFTMGATSAAIYNRDFVRPLGATIGVAALGVLLAGSCVLLFAIEGVLCLAMAAPIAVTIAIFGAIIGRAVVASPPRGSTASAPLFLFCLPGLAFGEARLATPDVHDVTTAIEIDAPPEQVWPNVVGFSDLDEPPAWFFRLGIAYPKRATISGDGVGAVRRCEFSTGAFVEPITDWSPPERLAFDVSSQPPAMTEWSPYGALHAPHLDGYMTSRGGEFDLRSLPGGRTRLVGTTHYTLAIFPEIYWVPYAEALLHAIHWRVLAHIKRLTERAAAARG
jgi:uncharacterized membrane protein YhaH (DUF805 family)